MADKKRMRQIRNLKRADKRNERSRRAMGNCSHSGIEPDRIIAAEARDDSKVLGNANDLC